MTALLAPVLPDPEVAHLRQVLKDMRFLLERGCWQAALAAARAALTHDEGAPAMSPRTQAGIDA
jgi:hypothetical protein